jgi:hypothetical protein
MTERGSPEAVANGSAVGPRHAALADRVRPNVVL